ncbi:PREDICTED: sensory neuron membrane protein 1-like isoform X2 [Dinoponera quadriceps]|uniref:Sensory neuron membrane protein 1-like isoform X2 n=1 Tax=Dinoponera quadriceps TaxID=609295 RepID=A0A6P3WNL3_DINQU|nr:PREDICTED: sensory neuron membrane protein 1-like isoform X2 [Dinoponera quadriceps]
MLHGREAKADVSASKRYDVAVRTLRRTHDTLKRTKLLYIVPFGRAFDRAIRVFEGYKTVKMVSIKKLAIGGAAMFLFGILFGFVGFPKLLRSQIKKAIALKPGSEIREMWTAFPLPLDFKVYMFNVTNADEIMQGGKPKLQEVGPFFYDEYKVKLDLIDREDDDSVEYSMKSIWYFNKKKSNGLTGDEDMVFPHLMILGMVMATLRDKPAAVGVVGKAVNSIFHNPDSIFVKAKAKDILFDGLPVDCTVTDFAGAAVCNVLKTEGKELIPDGEGRYKFSLFGGKNGTVVPERMRVMRGIKNFKDVGRVLEFDGKPALDIWPEDHCNQFNGTDSTIFPPLFGPDDDIVSFGFEICRSLSAHFSHHTKVKGVNTLRYTANLGDGSKNEDEKCFCPTPETCLTRNLYDMTKCLGVPIIGSLPHFYDSEEKYLTMVDGLNPKQENHEIDMDFEPMTATPIRAHKRLQFNMFVHPVPKFKLMKTFPEALLPLFWVEEGILLDDQFVNKVKIVFKAIIAVNFIKWLSVLGGIGMGCAAGALYYKNRDTGKLEITKVTPKLDSRADSKMEKNWPPGMNISTIQAASVPPSLDRN